MFSCNRQIIKAAIQCNDDNNNNNDDNNNDNSHNLVLNRLRLWTTCIIRATADYYYHWGCLVEFFEIQGEKLMALLGTKPTTLDLSS